MKSKKAFVLPGHPCRQILGMLLGKHKVSEALHGNLALSSSLVGRSYLTCSTVTDRAHIREV